MFANMLDENMMDENWRSPNYRWKTPTWMATFLNEKWKMNLKKKQHVSSSYWCQTVHQVQDIGKQWKIKR